MKNTADYDWFLELVGRKGQTGEMLRTPNKRRKYGRRQWDGLEWDWKQRVHRAVEEKGEGQEEYRTDVEFQQDRTGVDSMFEEIYKASGAPHSSWMEEVEDWRVQFESS